MKVFGIDIITGSVRSKTAQPKYALVIFDDGEIVSEESVSLFRLIRLVHRQRPDILAVDSLQEVAAHTQDIYRFLEQLPPRTMFVSVTGGEKKIGLIQVAARYNITFNKFDPFAEARAIAQVAYLGTGVEVLAFERETEISISRNRSPGKGGWSQNRYARKIHGNVLTYAREIEAELNSADLHFTKQEHKAFGGVSKVTYLVQEGRDLIPVSPSRGGDVQVRLKSRRLERIQFRPLSGKPQYLIIGIDPGTTVGIAALTLDGELVKLQSSRQMTMADVIESLYTVGRPVVVASDVTPMPFSVEKIRRAFQATAHIPRQDISVETKNELAGRYGYGNDHERDALTAAIEAWRFWNHKFGTISRRVPSGVDLNEVKVGIIRGLSLEQILEGLRIKPQKTEETKPEITIDVADERVRILDGMVKDLRNHITSLQKDLAEAKKENQKIRRDLSSLKKVQADQIRRDPEITRRDIIIENLKRRLRREERNNKKLQKRLKAIKKLDAGHEMAEGTPVKVLPDLSKESIRILSEKIGLNSGDLLYVRSIGSWGRASIHDLSETGVQAVIISEKVYDVIPPALSDLFFQEELPFINSRGLAVQMKGDLGIANPDMLEEALEAWEQSLSEFRHSQGEEMLDSVFKEYLAERERKVKKNE